MCFSLRRLLLRLRRRNRIVLGDRIGMGSFGVIRNCRFKHSRQELVCKISTKEKNADSKTDPAEMLLREANLLKTLQHPNIVCYIDFFRRGNAYHLLLSRCSGGELQSYIRDSQLFTEDAARLIVFQALQALKYLHANDVVHRDVKAENFMFAKPVENNRYLMSHCPLLLIDFGLSIRIQGEELLSQLCGSPHYIAPEIIYYSYSYKVDIWALGVLCFYLLFGVYPFDKDSNDALIHSILMEDLRYPQNVSVTAEAKDFVGALLRKRPEERPSAEAALKHKWFSNLDCESVVQFQTSKVCDGYQSTGDVGNFDKISRENSVRALSLHVSLEDMTSHLAKYTVDEVSLRHCLALNQPDPSTALHHSAQSQRTDLPYASKYTSESQDCADSHPKCEHRPILKNNMSLIASGDIKRFMAAF